jgi:tetratricopeptide (TPR) repeat protein
MRHRHVVFLLALLLAGCAGFREDRPPQSIDQVPMYGGMDRQSIPVLKKADDAFIESTSSAFGGRERAAQRWIDYGFRLYRQGNLEIAMRRFNQAWLLDPKNPEVYWGFASVQHDRGLMFGAYNMAMRAYQLGFRDPGFLADLGRVTALRTVEAKDLTPEQRAAFIVESESYYEAAIKSGENLGYIYDGWSSAKYWIGDYAEAWEKVKIARAYGAARNDHFLSMLRQKMPEPK